MRHHPAYITAAACNSGVHGKQPLHCYRGLQLPHVTALAHLLIVTIYCLMAVAFLARLVFAGWVEVPDTSARLLSAASAVQCVKCVWDLHLCADLLTVQTSCYNSAAVTLEHVQLEVAQHQAVHSSSCSMALCSMWCYCFFVITTGQGLSKRYGLAQCAVCLAQLAACIPCSVQHQCAFHAACRMKAAGTAAAPLQGSMHSISTAWRSNVYSQQAFDV